MARILAWYVKPTTKQGLGILYISLKKHQFCWRLTDDDNQASRVLAEHGFSTAIFGDAWTHEHFSSSSPSGRSMAECVQRSTWEGWPLPNDLGCDCREGMPHHTSFYRVNPIMAYAHEYPVGSTTYFETDFQGPFVKTMSKVNLRAL